MRTTTSCLFLTLVASRAFAGAPEPPRKPVTITVTSPAFTANGQIPSEYTCEGMELSPPMRWSNVPRDARSIAILVDDPDAPKRTFTHWIVTGIPAMTTALGAGTALPEGAVAGKSDAGKAGWTGPCPPSGRHRYVFHVYALDVPLARQLSRAEFLAAINGHVIGQGQLIGTYQKQKQ